MPFNTEEVRALFPGKTLTVTDTIVELFDGNRTQVAKRPNWQVDAWELTPKGEAIVNGTPMPLDAREEHMRRSLHGLENGPGAEATLPPVPAGDAKPMGDAAADEAAAYTEPEPAKPAAQKGKAK